MYLITHWYVSNFGKTGKNGVAPQTGTLSSSLSSGKLQAELRDRGGFLRMIQTASGLPDTPIASPHYADTLYMHASRGYFSIVISMHIVWGSSWNSVTSLTSSACRPEAGNDGDEEAPQIVPRGDDPNAAVCEESLVSPIANLSCTIIGSGIIALPKVFQVTKAPLPTLRSYNCISDDCSLFITNASLLVGGVAQQQSCYATLMCSPSLQVLGIALGCLVMLGVAMFSFVSIGGLVR